MSSLWKGSDERVLRHVLGVLGTHDPHRNPVHVRGVAVDELLERSKVTAERALDKRQILDGGPFHHA